MVDLRIPNINATSTDGKVEQIRSSLIQLTEQLNWAFNSISNGETMDSYREKQKTTSEVSKEEQASNTFSELKSLIIKSADIVDAYYREFDIRLKMSDSRPPRHLSH